MKVNLNVNFRTYNGMETGDKIADVVAQALYNYGKDRPVKREDKFLAWKVCMKVVQNPSEVEVTTEEATLIKEACGDILTAGGYGQIVELIEK
nr:MAG TPA: hypothetical protein [Caudoviricetes sp.]